MSQAGLPIRLVVYLRFARPALDLLVLAAALAGIVFLQARSNEQKTSRLDNARHVTADQSSNTRHLQKNKGAGEQPLFLTSHYNSEESMWQAWADWLRAEKPATGNCLIEPQGESNSVQFHLLCFGNASKRFEPVLPSSDIFFPTGVLKAHDTAGPRSRNKTAAEETSSTGTYEASTLPEVPDYTSSGWVDTPSGRKHFDPSTMRWMP